MSLTKATYSMIKGAPVNLVDYGAVGDGVADDTQAIRNAINAAAGSWVVGEPGAIYRITQPLDAQSGWPGFTGIAISSDVTLLGNTDPYHTHASYTTASEAGVWKILCDNTSLLGQVSGTTAYHTGATLRHRLKNMIVVTTNSNYAVVCGNGQDHLFDSCYFGNFGNHAIWWGAVILSKITRVAFRDIGWNVTPSVSKNNEQFVDGFAIRVDNNFTSGVSNNLALSSLRSGGNGATTININDIWWGLTANGTYYTQAAPTTSFKTFGIYNVDELTLTNVNSYSGGWLSLNNGKIDNCYFETYALGGDVANDAVYSTNLLADAITFNPDALTLTSAGAALFSAGDVGKYIFGDASGGVKFRIIKYISSTVVQVEWDWYNPNPSLLIFPNVFGTNKLAKTVGTAYSLFQLNDGCKIVGNLNVIQTVGWENTDTPVGPILQLTDLIERKTSYATGWQSGESLADGSSVVADYQALIFSQVGTDYEGEYRLTVRAVSSSNHADGNGYYAEWRIWYNAGGEFAVVKVCEMITPGSTWTIGSGAGQIESVVNAVSVIKDSVELSNNTGDDVDYFFRCEFLSGNEWYISQYGGYTYR